MKKNISILGSTGSIGLDAFKILSRKKNSFKVNILAANKNYNLICDQIIKFKPKIFIIDNQETYLRVKKRFISVLFPDPDLPLIANLLPFLNEKFKFLIAGSLLSG